MFSATFWHEITLYAIDIDKKRFRTPFLTLLNHFENRTSIAPKFSQQKQLCHIDLGFHYLYCPVLVVESHGLMKCCSSKKSFAVKYHTLKLRGSSKVPQNTNSVVCLTLFKKPLTPPFRPWRILQFFYTWV